MTKKYISLLLAIVLILGTVNSFAFAESSIDYTLYDQNGIKVRFERSGEMDSKKDKARPVRSGGEDGKAHLDMLVIHNQSTYGKRDPGKYYYRTVGYRLALLDKNFLPLEQEGLIPSNPFGVPLGDDSIDLSAVTAYLFGLLDDPELVKEKNIRGLVETRYFNTNEIRITEQQNMWKLIENQFKGTLWDKPIVTSMTISRDRLIRELGLQGREYLLDQAQYLVMAGEVEFYRTNADGSEAPAFSSTQTKIMYNPLKKKLVSYFDVPDIYKDYRDDIQTRIQLINLETGEITFITEDELTDLIVEKIDPGTAQTKPGAKHNGKVIIRRAAENATIGAMDTTLYLTIANGKLDGPADIPVTLSPGETKEVPFAWEVGQDRSKNVLIVAEINPAKLGENRIAEQTYDNNTKQAVVMMEQEKVDLAAIISNYTDAMFTGETETFEAIITNSSEKPVTTDVVWRVRGNQVKRSTVTIPAKGDITDRTNITMPNVSGSITVEVEVNPSRNKPTNEVTWANNKDSVSVFNLGVDDEPQTGESDLYLVP